MCDRIITGNSISPERLTAILGATKCLRYNTIYVRFLLMQWQVNVAAGWQRAVPHGPHGPGASCGPSAWGLGVDCSAAGGETGEGPILRVFASQASKWHADSPHLLLARTHLTGGRLKNYLSVCRRRRGMWSVYWALTCARCCSESIVWINSFNPQSNPKR